MRLREIAMLGHAFEFAPRPKGKSYVSVARNIVKMRKKVASNAKKKLRGVSSAVRTVRNKAKRSSLVKKASRAIKGGRGNASKSPTSPQTPPVADNNGHVFSDSDSEDGGESDEDEDEEEEGE